jgi:hypothetical protein
LYERQIRELPIAARPRVDVAGVDGRLVTATFVSRIRPVLSLIFIDLGDLARQQPGGLFAAVRGRLPLKTLAVRGC